LAKHAVQLNFPVENTFMGKKFEDNLPPLLSWLWTWCDYDQGIRGENQTSLFSPGNSGPYYV